MIYINCDDKGYFFELEKLRAQTIDFIQELQKDIDDETCPPEDQPIICELIRGRQNDLYHLSELEKIPFDLLVVIEKEEE